MELDIVSLTLVVATIGTIVTIIRIVIEYYTRIYTPRKKEEEEEEKRLKEQIKKKQEDLRSRILTCQYLKKEISNYIKNHVKQNEFKFTGFGLLQSGWGQAPTPKLQEKMKLFYEKVDDCKNWFEVCKRTLKLVLIENMRSYLPTSKNSYLEGLFGNILIEPIIKGVKISRSWLETERPDLVKEIQKKLDPSEDINEFFKKMNDSSIGEHSVEILKKKRKELIAYSEEFKKTIDTERQRLDQLREKEKAMNCQ